MNNNYYQRIDVRAALADWSEEDMLVITVIRTETTQHNHNVHFGIILNQSINHKLRCISHLSAIGQVVETFVLKVLVTYFS